MQFRVVLGQRHIHFVLGDSDALIDSVEAPVLRYLLLECLLYPGDVLFSFEFGIGTASECL